MTLISEHYARWMPKRTAREVQERAAENERARGFNDALAGKGPRDQGDAYRSGFDRGERDPKEAA